MKSSNYSLNRLKKISGMLFLNQIMYFIQNYSHESNHCSKLLAYEVILVTNQTEKNMEQKEHTCQG